MNMRSFAVFATVAGLMLGGCILVGSPGSGGAGGSNIIGDGGAGVGGGGGMMAMCDAKSTCAQTVTDATVNPPCEGSVSADLLKLWMECVCTLPECRADDPNNVDAHGMCKPEMDYSALPTGACEKALVGDPANGVPAACETEQKNCANDV